MKYLLIVLAFAFISKDLSAQKSMFILSYPIAFPLGDLKNYNTKTSFRGINAEFIGHIKKNFWGGLESGWQTFYDRVDQKTYTDGTASISGVQYRYTNTCPILLEGKWIRPTDSHKKTMPYAGLGLGTMYVERSTDFGLYRITNSTWQFCIRPEIGFMFKPVTGVAIFAGGKYYGNFGNSSLDGQSYVSINVGFVFASGY